MDIQPWPRPFSPGPSSLPQRYFFSAVFRIMINGEMTRSHSRLLLHRSFAVDRATQTRVCIRVGSSCAGISMQKLERTMSAALAAWSKRTRWTGNRE